MVWITSSTRSSNDTSISWLHQSAGLIPVMLNDNLPFTSEHAKNKIAPSDSAVLGMPGRYSTTGRDFKNRTYPKQATFVLRGVDGSILNQKFTRRMALALPPDDKQKPACVFFI